VENITEMPELLLRMAKDGDVVVTMGAGSIANVPVQLLQMTATAQG
jgi:UDP-N-acetylmuramate--alanine ligase